MMNKIYNLEPSIHSYINRLGNFTDGYMRQTHPIRFAQGALIKELKELEEKAKTNPTQELMAIIEKKRQVFQQMTDILTKAKELSFAPVKFELEKARIWLGQNSSVA